MKELVFLQADQALTTSLKVAEVFEKEHNDVLKSIRALILDLEGLGEISQPPMFQESTYTHQQNKQTYPMYLMTQRGFALLAMGFTGKKALKFKCDFFDAFDAIKKKLDELLTTRAAIRQSSIFTNKDLMKAVHDVVIPVARKNGSTTPDKIFYMNYNKLINRNARVPAGNRDGLPTTQLIMIDQMQNIAAAQIRTDSRQGKSHKEIYCNARRIVEGYAQVALAAERFPLLN